MFYILMNFGTFLKNIVIYSAILGVILIIVGYALGKPKKRTNMNTPKTTDNDPIVHIKYEYLVSWHFFEKYVIINFTTYIVNCVLWRISHVYNTRRN